MELIEAFGLKFGIYSHQNVCMKIRITRGQGQSSTFDLRQIQNFQKSFQRPLDQLYPNLEPPAVGRTKVHLNDPGQMVNMVAMPIYGKNFFSSTSQSIALELGK